MLKAHSSAWLYRHGRSPICSIARTRIATCRRTFRFPMHVGRGLGCWLPFGAWSPNIAPNAGSHRPCSKMKTSSEIGPVMRDGDQGSKFSSYDWQDFLRAHNLQQCMSRRGNCHDNAVAESFFQLLKRERIRRKTYNTREEARRDIFDYIEMFYNPKRRPSFSKQLSPMNYEKQYIERLASV